MHTKTANCHIQIYAKHITGDTGPHEITYTEQASYIWQ